MGSANNMPNNVLSIFQLRLNHYNNLMKWVLFLWLLYRCRNWGTKGLRNFPQIIRISSNRIKTDSLAPKAVLWSCYDSLCYNCQQEGRKPSLSWSLIRKWMLYLGSCLGQAMFLAICTTSYPLILWGYIPDPYPPRILPSGLWSHH